MLFEDETENYEEREVANEVQRISMKKDGGQKGPRENRRWTVTLHKQVEYDRVPIKGVQRVSEIRNSSSDGDVHGEERDREDQRWRLSVSSPALRPECRLILLHNVEQSSRRIYSGVVEK